ncbi:O-antigen ligase family protein [Leeuwenhoekiella aequorea]|nr:O-antigen ligase family protein [Leeuwenhoekiella aequorea]
MTIANGLLPILAISLYLREIDVKKLKSKIHLVLTITVTLLLLLIGIQYGFAIFGQFNTRIQLSGTTDATEGEFVINSILIGIYGSALAVSSLFNILILRYKWHYVMTFGFGLIAVLIAGSRGPVLNLLICSVFVIFYYIKKNKYKIHKIFFFIIFAFLGFIALVTLYYDNLIQTKTFIRITESIDNRKMDKKEARDFEWESAWNQFQDSPFIGDSYLNKFDNFYPHNFFLEVLMATGIIGLIPILFLFYSIYKHIKFNFSRENDFNVLISILCFLLFITTMTSGGIFTISYFWSCLPLFFLNYHSSKTVITNF